MNKEIYEKLDYRIKEKDRLMKEEENQFFDKVDRNTLKLYYKIWSDILKEVKRKSTKDLNFNLRYDFKVNCEKRGIKLYTLGSLRKSLIDLAKLERLLEEDYISINETNIIFEIRLELRIFEEDLRKMLESQKNNFKYLFRNKKEANKAAKEAKKTKVIFK